MSQSLTVVEYLMQALKEVNINHVFGVPGDFAFPINDAICHDADLAWIGCSNELNASYAADGYARSHGIAALNTTYGPGELSALCGVAGSYAANLPVIFMVGMPSEATMASGKLIHHTLGDGQFDTFANMADAVTATSTVLSLDNAVSEIQRIFEIAVIEKRPVYIGVPEDVAKMEIQGHIPSMNLTVTPSTEELEKEVAYQIALQINLANKPVLIVGEHLRVHNAKESALTVIEQGNLPFATMFADKAFYDETHPNFLGLYDGKVINRPLREYIESSDCVIHLGALMTDFNTGAYSATWPENTITILGNRIEINGQVYNELSLNNIIKELSQLIVACTDTQYPHYIGLVESKHDAKEMITAASLYPRWENFFKENDQIIAETGTISMGLGMAKLPKGASFQNQTLWGSIGWATPAALGAALAKPDQRTILMTGEGSHQLTVQAIGQFARYNQKPIIFVLNNDGYLIERILCEEPKIEYNDVCHWNYTQLPAAFGIKDWYCAKVTTNEELDQALEMASKAETGVYIEVITSDMETPPLAANLAAQLNVARGLPVHVIPTED